MPSMVRRTRGKLAAQRQLASSTTTTAAAELRVKREPQTKLIDAAAAADSLGSDNAPHHHHGEQKRLPQCKVKRNYACGSCSYFTQNPRSYLTHLRDTHGEKISVYECKRCVYASRHYQKLVRHLRMVHGGADVPVVESGSKGSATPVDNSEERREVIEKDSSEKDSASKVLDALGVSGAYTQQLVASLLPSLLLRNVEQTWTSSILGKLIILFSYFNRSRHGMEVTTSGTFWVKRGGNIAVCLESIG